MNDPALRVIETMRWDGMHLRQRDRHLARARQTCAALGFRYDPDAISCALEAVGGPDPLRVRLTVDRHGGPEVTTGPLLPTPELWRVCLSPHRLEASDPWLAHKTTRRAIYDRIRTALPTGIDEALFLNGAGEVCEGTITNIFFDTGNGLCTPPLRCGLLPGVLRAEMIASGKCREAVLRHAEIWRAQIWAGNALRGLIPVRMMLETLPSLQHK